MGGQYLLSQSRPGFEGALGVASGGRMQVVFVRTWEDSQASVTCPAAPAERGLSAATVVGASAYPRPLSLQAGSKGPYLLCHTDSNLTAKRSGLPSSIACLRR